MSKTSEKLKKLAKNRNVTLVLPCVPTVGANKTGRAEYLRDKMREVNEVKTIKLPEVEYDGRNHPKIEGTVKILEEINKEMLGTIILDKANKEDLTSNRSYFQVQPIYKVGCRGCETLEYTSSLCPKCIEAAQKFNVDELQKKIELFQEQQFPGFSTDEDVEMKINNKRESDRSSDVVEKKVKHISPHGST